MTTSSDTNVVRTLVSDARRLVDGGDAETAARTLRSSVGRHDDLPASLHRARTELAAAVEAPDLELHFALAWLHAAPGTVPARDAVLIAATRSPDLRAAVYRIVKRRGTVEDWVSIAGADALGSWPAFGALAIGGPSADRTIAELGSEGVLAEQGEAPFDAWVLDDARVTRSARSLVVGSYARSGDGVPRIVPAFCVGDCSAALGWAAGEPRREPGRQRIGLLATQFGFSGYWHWLFEGLLPILRLDLGGLLAGLDQVVVCVDGPPLPAVRASLTAAGIDASRVALVEGDFDIRVDALALPVRHRDAGGLVERGAPTDLADIAAERSRHRNDPEIEALRHRLGVDRPRAGRSRRLLISRSDATTRRVTNEAALRQALEPEGFELVHLGGLAFEEQVAAFADAEVVIGPHGAGFANLLFAGPGTRVVELQHPGAARSHYRRLAELLGLVHTDVPCDADPASGDDMVVDVERCLAAYTTNGT